MSITCSFLTGTRRFRLLLGAAFACAALAPATAAPPQPQQVDATYQIALSGLNIGQLRYQSTLGGNHYEVAGDIDLSMFFGAFFWKGALRTSGVIADATLKPEMYTFEYRNSSRASQLRMGFDKSGRPKVNVSPAPASYADSIALKDEHIREVIDPLTAMAGLVGGRKDGVCNRRLSIFDGQQRFDLSFAFLRTEELNGRPATVCGLKYTPIAGYRPTSDVRAMAQNSGIEIAFQSTRQGGVLVPISVALPLPDGILTLTIESIDVRTGKGSRLAQESR
jgi:Protein of unknown function (DUF3108)